MVLMPDTDERAADHVARRVVSGIVRQRHTISDDIEVSVGASAGLAIYPSDGTSPELLLRAADSAMYGVKRNGGKHVERWNGPELLEPAPMALAG